jgi:hypothetical protein
MLRGCRWMYITDVSRRVGPIFKAEAVKNASLLHGNVMMSRNAGKSYQPTPRNI